MRHHSVLLVAVALVALLALAGGVAAYDHSHRERLADGVRVGDIPLGGLSRAQAQRRLRRDLLQPLEQPVLLHHGSRTFRLGPRESHVAVDVAGLVDRALAASRTGNVLTRTWRGLTGGTVHAQIEPEIVYSEAAVVRVVDRVRKALERDPHDATLRFGGDGGFTKVAGEDGVGIDAGALHVQVRRAIVDPHADHDLTVGTHTVKPKITTDELAQQYGTILVVDRSAYRLRLYKGLQLSKTYEIAVGAQGLETPAGLYHIQNKAVNPAWNVPDSDWAGDLRGKVVPSGDPKNPIRARWMGIFDGAGIHGIPPSEYGSIGHAASHGCVRMRIPDVEDLYDRVPVGAPIYIA
jgi:lipoprotein-anchoring transpeptidase ErfK/SrfK